MNGYDYWWLQYGMGIPWTFFVDRCPMREANEAIDILARDARSLMVAAIQAAQEVT